MDIGGLLNYPNHLDDSFNHIPALYTLSDFSGATIDFNNSLVGIDLNEIMLAAKSKIDNYKTVCNALFADNETNEAIFKFYSRLIGGAQNYHLEVFADIDSAKLWLKSMMNHQ